MIYSFTTYSPEQTIALGEQIGKRLCGGEVIAYSGGLGAGKTTITRGISVGMGLGDEVTSPTFALVNEYAGRDRSLCHFDMYRISGAEDLETTGFYDYLDGNNVLAVEYIKAAKLFAPPLYHFAELRRLLRCWFSSLRSCPSVLRPWLSFLRPSK